MKPKGEFTRRASQVQTLAEEKEAKTSELERFKGYKNELIDIVNDKEAQLIEAQSQSAELTRQVQAANLTIEKAT